MKPRVELIYDTDCPNVEEARTLILRAFGEAHVKPSWVELDRKAPDTPAYARRYGSPTILVEGKDVSGADSNNNADCCRLYVHERGYHGVPELAQMVQALKQSSTISAEQGFSWRRFAASVPSLAALLPVLHCPACWPAYAGILSALGLGFLSDAAYLLPITTVLLAAALFALGYKARSRHGYIPLASGLLATAAIVAGKFWLTSDPVLYGGLTVLVVASIWNAWPRKETYCAKN
jgi:hypothetical protein